MEDRNITNRKIAEFYGMKYFPFNSGSDQLGWWVLDDDGNPIEHIFNTRLTKDFEFDKDYHWLMIIVERCYEMDKNCKLLNHVFDFNKLYKETYKYILDYGN